jgi:hypothetical protein
MRHRFSICACARWETPYIVEWLNYYRSIGFDHVYLYCNDDDPTSLYETTLAFQDSCDPFLTFRHFPYQGQQDFMYRHFLQNDRMDSEWIAFLDIDEFLILRAVDNIHRFMARFEREYDSLYFNWCFYGNSSFAIRPPGSVLLQYPKRHSSLHPFTKTLTRTSAIDLSVLESQRMHFWHRWDAPASCGMRCVNVLEESMVDYYTDFPTHAAAFLNSNCRHRRIINVAFIAHFAFKSKEDFLRRVERGTLGNFSEQIIWKQLHDEGTVDSFLERLNEVDDAYLKDYWRQKLADAWDTSIVRRSPHPNLALRQPAMQSSVSQWSIGATPAADASGAVTGQPTGRYGFHTSLEDGPWWMVDLGTERTLTEIRIFNRMDDTSLAVRARRLEVAVLGESQAWQTVFRKEDESVFGGVDGRPLILPLQASVCGRYVRVQLVGRGFLHLDQVEVYGF